MMSFHYEDTPLVPSRSSQQENTREKKKFTGVLGDKRPAISSTPSPSSSSSSSARRQQPTPNLSSSSYSDIDDDGAFFEQFMSQPKNAPMCPNPIIEYWISPIEELINATGKKLVKLTNTIVLIDLSINKIKTWIQNPRLINPRTRNLMHLSKGINPLLISHFDDEELEAYRNSLKEKEEQFLIEHLKDESNALTQLRQSTIVQRETLENALSSDIAKRIHELNPKPTPEEKIKIGRFLKHLLQCQSSSEEDLASGLPKTLAEHKQEWKNRSESFAASRNRKLKEMQTKKEQVLEKQDKEETKKTVIKNALSQLGLKDQNVCFSDCKTSQAKRSPKPKKPKAKPKGKPKGKPNGKAKGGKGQGNAKGALGKPTPKKHQRK